MPIETTACIFCEMDRLKLAENEAAFVIEDKFPVVVGHCLIIPKRHFANYFEITSKELAAVHELILITKNQLTEHDPSILGFNIGINQGIDAGQTVMHCHIHLIPRRKGDVAEPRGGIRHLIPGKGFY